MVRIKREPERGDHLMFEKHQSTPTSLETGDPRAVASAFKRWRIAGATAEKQHESADMADSFRTSGHAVFCGFSTQSTRPYRQSWICFRFQRASRLSSPNHTACLRQLRIFTHVSSMLIRPLAFRQIRFLVNAVQWAPISIIVRLMQVAIAKSMVLSVSAVCVKVPPIRFEEPRGYA